MASRGARPKPWQIVAAVALTVVGAVGLLAGAGLLPAQDRQGTSAAGPRPAAVGDFLGSSRRGAEAALPSPPLRTAAPGGTSARDLTVGEQPRVEESGELSVVVPGARIQADLNRLMALATGAGGYVSSTSTQASGPGTQAQADATLQVPEASFGPVASQAKALGKVASFSTSADDVTGQYVDLQSQITALQGTRRQYLTIMAQAKTVGQVLAVQAQLDDVDSQLQQLQGQLQLMSNETTYATLNVTLSAKTLPPPPRHPASGMAKAWDAAVSGFVGGAEGVVRVGGPLLFALLLASALFACGRWAWRLWRRPQPTPPVAETGP